MAVTLSLALAGPAPAVITNPYVARNATVPGGANLRGISAVGPGDLWAVASSGAIYHYNGTTWAVSTPVPTTMNAISALDSTHVWAVGNNGTIKFYNGTSWSDQSLATSSICSVFALDAAHVWASGLAGKVYFFNGTTWTERLVAAGGQLNSVFALDPRHVWTVGITGTIYFWNGSTWIDQSTGGNNLNGVYGLDTNCVWAVGQGGTIQFWDGFAWSGSTVGATNSLMGVFALDIDHLYVAGEFGLVFYWDGTEWTQLISTTGVQYRGIDALDTDHIYAVGDSSTFTRWYSTLEAQSTDFYFAEGTCRPTFDPYLCIQNPDETTDAVLRVTLMLGDGGTRTLDYTVPRSSRSTIAVKSVLGSGDDAAHDFSAKVECTNSVPIIAERPMYFRYLSSTGVDITGGSDVVGALQPRPRFYFAEGTCRPNFDPYICIQNPGATNALVTVLYMLGDGSTVRQDLTVRAHSRQTVIVKNMLGSGDDAAHDFSAIVQTTNGTNIVAERPMYFAYNSSQGIQVTGGHDVVGAATPARSFYFAEGTCRPNFDPYICIQNPGADAAQVRITYMLGNGVTREQALDVPGNSRQTVVVKSVLGSADDAAHDFSAKVESVSGGPIIAERPMYFNYSSSRGVPITGGHDVVGALYPAGAYYFAEGTCRPDFDPYLCIQNPGDAGVNVVITYMLGNGGLDQQTIPVDANSRFTVMVKDKLGSGDDAAHDFSAKVRTLSEDDDIIVERPMYFNYYSSLRTRLTGGHDVVGYSP
jgi:hypothetical protein